MKRLATDCAAVTAETNAKYHELLVDLDQLAKNLEIIKKLMQPARICAVLKNNAYGHGLLQCATVLAKCGISDFGIVNNQEIKTIRLAPELVLRKARLWRIRPSLPWEREEAFARNWDVIEQVGSLNDLEWAKDAPRRMKIALSLDCSMGREGFGVPSHLDDLAQTVKVLGAERIAGVMTHLAIADGNSPALRITERQLDDFDAAVLAIRSGLPDDCLIHAGNSAAGLRLARVRQYHMVRSGASLFGEATSPMVDKPSDLAPCLTWRTWIAQVREIPAGARIGYGSIYLATQDERVATLPIGYADGLKKSLGNGNGEVLVRGVRCPIRGNISSASTVIGVSHVPGNPICPGEEVVIIGRQGEEFQSPDDLAISAGTGHLDIQAGISAPILYLPDNGRTAAETGASISRK